MKRPELQLPVLQPREKYRPSNGTEGEGFIECWCDECERDRAYRENPDAADGCDILARTLAFDTNDEHYPEEWTYNAEEVPICTAFIPEGDKLPTDKELEAAGQLRLDA